MNITPQDMAAQLGRYLGRISGDVFVEPDATIKGTIYATVLPQRSHRLDPAVSIVPQPSAGDEPMALTQRIVLVLHAQGHSNQIVMSKLAAYQAILWPRNRPVVLTETPHMPGIIGVPSAAGDHSVWRIIEMNQLSYAQPNPRTPSGLASAEIAIEIHALVSSVTVEE